MCDICNYIHMMSCVRMFVVLTYMPIQVRADRCRKSVEATDVGSWIEFHFDAKFNQILSARFWLCSFGVTRLFFKDVLNEALHFCIL